MKKTSLLILSLLACLPAFAEVRHSDLVARLERAQETFRSVVNSSTGAIPPGILARAKGIMIFREYGAGFIIGGKAGEGVAMERQRDGRWGPPAFFGIAEGSFGLQIGVQEVDLVFLFMDRDSLLLMHHPKFRIGVDAAAAAGPVGADAEAKVGAPILVYTNDKGLYAGASFEGAALGPDKDADAAFYRQYDIGTDQILTGHVRYDFHSVDRLDHMLLRYEGWRGDNGDRDYREERWDNDDENYHYGNPEREDYDRSRDNG